MSSLFQSFAQMLILVSCKQGGGREGRRPAVSGRQGQWTDAGDDRRVHELRVSEVDACEIGQFAMDLHCVTFQ